MSAENAYVFQLQIPQIMSAKSKVGEISQQPADQLPKFQANSFEFDWIKMQATKEKYP